MMMRYEHLTKYPSVFLQVTGLRVPEFDRLVKDVAEPLAERERVRLHKAQRQRAVAW